MNAVYFNMTKQELIELCLSKLDLTADQESMARATLSEEQIQSRLERAIAAHRDEVEEMENEIDHLNFKDADNLELLRSCAKKLDQLGVDKKEIYELTEVDLEA